MACIPRRPNEGDWLGQQELIAHASRIRSVYVSVEPVERIRSLLSCILSNRIPCSLTTLLYPELDCMKRNPRTVLEALPNLRALILERFKLVESVLSGITRSDDQATFPRLSILRLHSCQVPNHDPFKSMIASHPIQNLEIWHNTFEWDGKEMSYKPSASSPLYIWLHERVPKIYVVTP
ncbi:hypothetical protein ACGC1H_004338 [Rhizoctonia solani]